MTQPINFLPGGHYMLDGIPYQVLTLPDNETLVVKNLATQETCSQQKSVLWKCWAEATLLFLCLRADKNSKERQ